MVDTDSNATERDGSVSRRTFVKAAGASGAAAGLAGCIYGGGGDQAGGKTVLKWGFDPTAAQEVGEEIKQAFHDHGLSKDIELQLVPGNADTGQRRSNYNRILSSGQATPDLFLMDNGWTNIFIAREQLQNLTQLLPSETVSTIDDQYFTSFTETARGSNGDLYGSPLFPDFPTMLYRQDIVEEAGFEPESENWATEPMTWKKFSRVTKQSMETLRQTKDTQKAKNNVTGFTFQFDIYAGLSCCDFNEFMSTWGGAYFGGREYLFGPVGERPVTVNEQPVVNAVKMVETFVEGQDNPLSDYESDISTANVLSYTENPSLSPFLSGDAVMHRNWPYAITDAGSEEEFGENLGVMPIPYAVEEQPDGTGGSISALGGWHITANPNSENKEAVKEVIRTHVESDDLQLKLMEIWGWLPPKKKLFNSSRAREVQPIGRYLDTLRIAGNNAMPRPVTAVWSSQSSAIASKVHAAVSGKRPPKQALNDLKQQIVQIENSK